MAQATFAALMTKAAIAAAHCQKGSVKVQPDLLMSVFGMWRSPVAYLHGVQGVVGSNPAIPTETGPSAYWQKGLFIGTEPPRRGAAAGVVAFSDQVLIISGFCRTFAASKRPLAPYPHCHGNYCC